MAVYQKSEFYDAAMSEMKSGNYPSLAARLAVGDVTITQQIGAIAQMAAMLSYQIGLAEVEPWIKARDNMVLADAAKRGVLPYGKAAVYRANVINRGTSTRIITSGRRLLDNSGRIWTVVDGASIDAGKTGTVQISQYETQSVGHVVNEKQAFYRIEVSKPETDSYFLDIALMDSSGGYFSEAERYHNVSVGDKVYHLVSDELMNLCIQFGVENVAGYVPSVGEEFTIVTRYTKGNVSLSGATPLDLEYIESGEEYLTILSASQVSAGAKPFDIDELREITNYPSLYDSNAVFLGEFSFLVRRKLSPFTFLNVWNEREEELARGASINNINCLFVSFIKSGMAEADVKKLIEQVIKKADNSYQVKFVNPVQKSIPVTVKLSLAAMHDDASVSSKVRLYLLSQYGKDSAWAKKGGQRINWQNTIKGLRENIVELQDGISDISLNVTQSSNALPEEFAYVSESSIKITVEKLY